MNNIQTDKYLGKSKVKQINSAAQDSAEHEAEEGMQ